MFLGLEKCCQSRDRIGLGHHLVVHLPNSRLEPAVTRQDLAKAGPFAFSFVFEIFLVAVTSDKSVNEGPQSLVQRVARMSKITINRRGMQAQRVGQFSQRETTTQASIEDADVIRLALCSICASQFRHAGSQCVVCPGCIEVGLLFSVGRERTGFQLANKILPQATAVSIHATRL